MMTRSASFFCSMLAMLVSTMTVAGDMASTGLEHTDVERRHFRETVLLGQIHYLAEQGQYYEALQSIADNDLLSEDQIRERLKQRKLESNNASLSLADIERAYRMNQVAGSAVREVLDADMELKKRNQAAYELAHLYYDKQQYDYARFALQLIRGDLYFPFEHDVAYLIAMLDARTGKVEQAMEALEDLKGDDRNTGFVAFNLAHLQLTNGEVEAGIRSLIEVGELQSEDAAVRALSDKANIVLGYRYLEAGELQQAIKYLSRVKLDGVFTNKASLGLSWAYMKTGDYRAAIVPWTHLSQRKPVDSAVLESYIALPYVYGKLGAHNKAAVLYKHAIGIFAEYETVLAASLESLGEGDVLAVGKHAADQTRGSELLIDLLASKQYHESYNNYLDLKHMSSVLKQRKRSLAMTQSMVTERNRNYEIDIIKLDEQLARIDERLQVAKQHRDELDVSISEFSARFDNSGATAQQANLMYASLDGVSVGAVVSDVPAGDVGVEMEKDHVTPEPESVSLQQRLATIREQRDEIDHMMRLAQSKRDLIMARRDALTSYEEFLLPVATLSERVKQLDASMSASLDEQTALLRSMAGDALQGRMDLIKEYSITAKYELAKSYDVIADKEKRQ